MYTKQQILCSKTYRQHQDVLAILLSEDKTYTHEEIQKLLDIFLNKKIKELIN